MTSTSTRLPVAARAATASLLVGALLLTTACSPSGEAASSDRSGDELSIVTSTSIWGDVAAAVTLPEDVEITPIVENQDADPHSFEPSAADMARLERADIVVVGGGGYDAWLYDALPEDSGTPLIHALPLLGGHDHGDHEGHDHAHEVGDNEHVWYDPRAVAEVAGQVAEAVTELDPEAEVDVTGITDELEAIESRLAELPELRVAQTEPIADHLLAHTQLTEVTPEGYRATALSHSEPTAADLAAFLELIEAGGLDLLIYNPQTTTDLTDRLRKEAATAGIPIVEIRETPPEGENFLDYFADVVTRLAQATGAEQA